MTDWGQQNPPSLYNHCNGSAVYQFKPYIRHSGDVIEEGNFHLGYGEKSRESGDVLDIIKLAN
jgi:hypothetical protein